MSPTCPAAQKVEKWCENIYSDHNSSLYILKKSKWIKIVLVLSAVYLVIQKRLHMTRVTSYKNLHPLGSLPPSSLWIWKKKLRPKCDRRTRVAICSNRTTRGEVWNSVCLCTWHASIDTGGPRPGVDYCRSFGRCP